MGVDASNLLIANSGNDLPVRRQAIIFIILFFGSLTCMITK